MPWPRPVDAAPRWVVAAWTSLGVVAGAIWCVGLWTSLRYVAGW